MTRVLVSGAGGFIGLPLLARLVSAGEEVHAISRRERPPEAPGVCWHRLDLADHTAVEELIGELAPERLVHLAWCTEHGRFWDDPENVAWVERSLRLLRAFVRRGGRRSVMLGTCAEYDWSAVAGPLVESGPLLEPRPPMGSGPLTESRPPTESGPLVESGPLLEPRSPMESRPPIESGSSLAPATLYGVAKDALRRVASAYAEREGVELAWGRLFFLYGPREARGRLVPSVIRALLAGEAVATGGGEQIRDFMHVEDAAGAVAALLDSSVVGAVNIASGAGVTVGEVLDRIVHVAGRPELVRRGALPDRPGEPRSLVADVARLREEVGFRPRWTLADGLAGTVRWWEQQRA